MAKRKSCDVMNMGGLSICSSCVLVVVGVFDPCIMWICVMSRVCLAGLPAGILTWQSQHWTLYANFSAKFSIYAMLTGIIGFYHFMPLSLILTFSGGHMISTEQNVLSSFSLILFI